LAQTDDTDTSHVDYKASGRTDVFCMARHNIDDVTIVSSATAYGKVNRGKWPVNRATARNVAG